MFSTAIGSAMARAFVHALAIRRVTPEIWTAKLVRAARATNYSPLPPLARHAAHRCHSGRSQPQNAKLFLICPDYGGGSIIVGSDAGTIASHCAPAPLVVCRRFRGKADFSSHAKSLLRPKFRVAIPVTTGI